MGTLPNLNTRTSMLGSVAADPGNCLIIELAIPRPFDLLSPGEN